MNHAPFVKVHQPITQLKKKIARRVLGESAEFIYIDS